MGARMELRHLRYFVAVADAGSLTVAAQRPLKGDTPTIDLVLGYKKSNQSPILKLLLSRLDELVARVSKRAH